MSNETSNPIAGTESTATNGGDDLASWLDDEPEAEGGSPEADDEALEAEGEEGAEGEEPEAPEDPVIKLDDGTEIPLSELKQGYSRQADYTRKTQELAAQRGEIEAKAARANQHLQTIAQKQEQIEKAFETTLQLLANQLPPEPDAALAYTDPQAYMQHKAFYDQRMAEINRVVAARDAQRLEMQKAEQAQERELVAATVSEIQRVFPATKDPVKLRAYFENVDKVAEEYGFTPEERMMTVKDARIAKMFGDLVRLKAIAGAGKRADQPQAKPGARAPMPGQVRPKTDAVAVATSSKAVREFRSNGSVDAARKALESGAFDNFI